VGTDPEPDESISDLDRESAMVTTHPCRPETPDLLEVKRRVTWVLLQVRVGLIGKLLDVLR
jgi:hypothetical protein